ncbi:MAG: NAD(P)H-dependent oxidoreductase subunit E [Pseudomonadota bacterium]|jgi:NADH-quinone oxidoreductase subunit E|nr:NAD(P)H-dependent oxidoreductase subunit E [Pseudomonadota bacterium]MEC9097560.1 NAD(P)H-dependent oxidoreductase subunit E [Pseudomonadota bacterium]MED5254256.1 NAD(P)H-dependent oxidoreductase subunit E [Pseudomonadota bacterium]MED5273308.1 NAD(P)H-dependent oxidoreductase subunit E [Pseudomonadota bacterium]MED5484172.1 NAD(P)H-dependent oxidoreductase subunit E [Pseudomonadota bacterium]|tara:strand:- start:152 stop:727 length:576 start_codon:yes stop_codon:yes gene_type:complete
MTVRRLADNQDIDFNFDDKDLIFLNSLLENYPNDKKQSAVVPSLFYAQKKAGGWLPEKAIIAVSDFLDMPKIRVLEIATFYSMFNLQPSGDYFVQVCGTTPCWLRGADKVKKACKDYIGQEREVSKDGLCWIEVECLGACVNAPMIQINDDYYEDLDYESTVKILKDIKNKKNIVKGSQIGRKSSEPLERN